MTAEQKTNNTNHMSGITQLFPQHAEALNLQGLYLSQELQHPGRERPFVYSNFVSSLDGRIALPAPVRNTHQVPAAIANPRDWRLYQELGAQADLLLTSARYYRQFALGEAQDTLPVGMEERFADLRQWRIEQGLKPQPDLAIASASLDIPARALAAYRNRQIHVLTGSDSPPDKRRHLEQLGIKVHLAGEGLSADGRQMVDIMGQAGYRSIYVIAGPSLLYSLLQDARLDRLYLTQAHCILGGEDFDTISWGSELRPPQKLRLRSLYYDSATPADCGQLLASYDCLTTERLTQAGA